MCQWSRVTQSRPCFHALTTQSALIVIGAQSCLSPSIRTARVQRSVVRVSVMRRARGSDPDLAAERIEPQFKQTTRDASVI